MIFAAVRQATGLVADEVVMQQLRASPDRSSAIAVTNLPTVV
ncbi:MAG: hypothetical protein QOD58_3099 [Mycobacterium sp.]|nr:hypothetical protein [Mycobacterium sp.]